MIEWIAEEEQSQRTRVPPTKLTAEVDGWKVSVTSAEYGDWFYVAVRRQFHGIGQITFAPLNLSFSKEVAIAAAEALLEHARRMVKENHEEASNPNPHHCGADTGHLRLGDHEELDLLRQAG